jgi:hypothetical protein
MHVTATPTPREPLADALGHRFAPPPRRPVRLEHIGWDTEVSSFTSFAGDDGAAKDVARPGNRRESRGDQAAVQDSAVARVRRVDRQRSRTISAIVLVLAEQIPAEALRSATMSAARASASGSTKRST